VSDLKDLLQAQTKLKLKLMDIIGTGTAIDQVRQSIEHAVEDMVQNLTLPILELGKSFKSLMAPFMVEPNPNTRIPGEHPVDWVLRVGRHTSGHNIYEGEAWRFRVLRDWWQGDDVDDEYGTGWKR